MLRDPHLGKQPHRLVRAIAKQTLDSFWAKYPPTQDDKLLALQTIVDPTIIPDVLRECTNTNDEAAVHALDVVLKHGADPDAIVAPAGGPELGQLMGAQPGTKFVTPCTLTQIVVIRPVLLQRLMSKKRIKVNQRQAGYNATLLHITVLLYMNPPQLMLKVLQPDKAGSTAKDRSMIQKRLIESAKLLLKSGADPFIPDALGSLPLRYALQYAGRLGQTELAEVLFAAMYGEHANPKELSVILKLSPEVIIEQLSKLAQQATPISSSSINSAGSNVGSQHDQSGLMELPPAAICRAHMLLLAGEHKFTNYDQVIKLIPIASIPELFPALWEIGNTVLVHCVTPNMTRESGYSQRLYFRASPAPISAAGICAWTAALRRNPRHLGLYAMLRWNTNLHAELRKDPELLKLATQGAKALLVYTQHRLHASSAASQSTPTSSNSHKDSLAARVKRCVHGFEEMAFATSAFVSWLVESADILEVTDNMALFAPLGRETDHHMDLLKLLALGHMQAARGLGSLCYFPDVAVDVLQNLAENGGDNDAAGQMAAAIEKVVKRAAGDEVLEFDELQKALRVAKCLLRATFKIYATVYLHCREDAVSTLKAALSAICALQGSRLQQALSAAVAITFDRYKLPAAMAACSDPAMFHHHCLECVQAIRFAAEECPAIMTAVQAEQLGKQCAASGLSSPGSASGSCKKPTNLQESQAAAILRQGIHLAMVGRLSAAAAMPGGSVAAQLLEDTLAGRPLHRKLVQLCLIEHFDAAGLQSAAATAAASIASSNLGQGRSAADDADSSSSCNVRIGYGRSPKADELSRLSTLISDVVKVQRSDKCCWNCGKSAPEAAKEGLQVTQGVDGCPQLLRCSACKQAVYCCVKCQKKHWSAHKTSCKKAYDQGS